MGGFIHGHNKENVIGWGYIPSRIYRNNKSYTGGYNKMISDFCKRCIYFKKGCNGNTNKTYSGCIYKSDYRFILIYDNMDFSIVKTSLKGIELENTIKSFINGQDKKSDLFLVKVDSTITTELLTDYTRFIDNKISVNDRYFINDFIKEV